LNTLTLDTLSIMQVAPVALALTESSLSKHLRCAGVGAAAVAGLFPRMAYMPG
jgi:hypothetical protein